MRFSLPAVVALLAAEASAAGRLRPGPGARAEDRELQAKGKGGAGDGIRSVGKDYKDEGGKDKDEGGDRATYGRPLSALSENERTKIVTLTKECRGRAADCCRELAEGKRGTVKQVFELTLACELTLPDNTLNALSGDSKVAAEEPNGLVWASDVTWGLDRVDQASLPLDNSFTKADAAGTRVFIIDTGVRLTHGEFDGIVGPDCHINTSNDGVDDDCNGHGTHVASTACGAEYGVAENCELCSVKVLSCSGSGSTAGVIAGIEYARATCEAKPCVVNMSLGGGFSQALNNAVAAAHDDGLVVVVAAGNSNDDACNHSPASEPKAITVGSTTSADAVSAFSSRGACVDVYDPGSGITGAWIGSNHATNTISGTSMASPHVAGIAAGVIAQMGGPDSDPAAVAQRIVDTAVRKGQLACAGCNPAVGDKGLATFYARGPTPAPTPPAPTPPPTPCGATPVVVSVMTDNYPAETSWDIKQGKDIILSAGHLSAKATLHEEELCLSRGDYVFTIYDTWGDGICCSYGSGSYLVRVDNTIVKEGGQFLASESTPFEVSGPPTLPPTAPPTPPPTTPPVRPPTSPPPTSPPVKAPTKPPTKVSQVLNETPTTAPTFFSCAQYSEGSCTADKECQWTGTCHNCGCVPLPRQL